MPKEAVARIRRLDVKNGPNTYRRAMMCEIADRFGHRVINTCSRCFYKLDFGSHNGNPAGGNCGCCFQAHHSEVNKADHIASWRNTLVRFRSPDRSEPPQQVTNCGYDDMKSAVLGQHANAGGSVNGTPLALTETTYLRMTAERCRHGMQSGEAINLKLWSSQSHSFE